MGRQLEFEPGEALQKAMVAFWSKGYERTSVSDLENSTGIGRKSLYRMFEGKEQLFLAVLVNYQHLMAKQNLSALMRAEADVADIRGLLDKLVSSASTSEGSMGCLICNTAVEFGRENEAIANHVEAFFTQIRRALLNALKGAIAKKQIELTPSEVTAEVNFLFGIIQSLCVLGRAGVSKNTLNDVVSTALKRLG